MNSQEAELQYPLGDELPPEGLALPVAPGVKWVRLGLPFQLNHINTWLLRDRVDGQEGWCIVDCGIDQAQSRAHWESVFESSLEGLPVVRVLVTHMHPDHLGLAHWLCERWQAPLFISTTDYLAAKSAMQIDTHYGGAPAAEFFALHGLQDEVALERVRTRGQYYLGMVPAVPPRHHRLLDQRVLNFAGQEWTCWVGYGHAPEHIALHSPELGVFISGDMVLPRISTNVSVYESEPEADPLLMFMQSLERMRALPSDTLVLPSHGRPFKGLHRRIDQLESHHHERLAEIMAACVTRPLSAMDAVSVLFARDLDLHQLPFALGESIAHLHTLWHQGQLRRERDAKGVYRFKPTAEWSRA